MSSMLGTAAADIVEAANAGRLLLLEGIIDRPEELFSWTRLDEVLRADELDWVHPHIEGGGLRHRLALFREGQAVDPETFFRRELSPRRQLTAAIDPARFAAQLREGGTFVVRDLDREDARVRLLAEGLESAFSAPVMGGVFASWGNEIGFGLHWDVMDNLAVQVSGSRSWTLWAPSTRHPVAGMHFPPPDGDGDWCGTLHAGDALFFPRGWWHRPEGRGEPALHLTFGIYRRTGLDLARWLCENARWSDADTIRFDRDLLTPWGAGIISEYLSAEAGRGLHNRLTFEFSDITVR